MHTAHPSLPDVTASRAVWFVLEEILKAEPPPRSWTTGDKELWAKLPPAIRRVVAKREQDDERGLRIAQNKHADENKKLADENKKLADELKKLQQPQQPQKETDDMAKKQGWEKVLEKPHPQRPA